ncbi:unnamed protein product [Leptosia nina]|uniref:Gustatory receptor n=1 Tax=Leptosia nina TaxID=320188 RepID=A0AAV1JQR2_9NEOP
MSSKTTSNDVQNIKNTFTSLNPLLKIFGLNCDTFQCEKTILSLIAFLLPAVIIGCADAYSMYYKLQHTYSQVTMSIKYVDGLQVIFDYFQYLIDLYVVYKTGVYIQNYYNTYRKIDENLALKYCSAVQKKLRIIVIYFGFIWLFSCACDYGAWIYTSGFDIATSFFMSYVFILIKILTSIDMTSHILHVEYRLSIIGDIAESMCNKNVWATEERPAKVLVRRRDILTEIQCLKKCYLWIIELNGFINQVFGARVLLNSLSILIDMVRFTNITARLLLGSQHLTRHGKSVFPEVSTVMRFLTCVAVLYNLAKHCELAYKKRERIIDIIDRTIVFKEPGEDVKVTLLELQQLIQARPVDFTLHNLTRIDYSLLGSMTSIVVTYTIILLQSVN